MFEPVALLALSADYCDTYHTMKMTAKIRDIYMKTLFKVTEKKF